MNTNEMIDIITKLESGKISIDDMLSNLFIQLIEVGDLNYS